MLTNSIDMLTNVCNNAYIRKQKERRSG